MLRLQCQLYHHGVIYWWWICQMAIRDLVTFFRGRRRPFFSHVLSCLTDVGRAPSTAQYAGRPGARVEISQGFFPQSSRQSVIFPSTELGAIERLPLVRIPQTQRIIAGRRRYQAVLFHPIIDVLLVLCSTCRFPHVKHATSFHRCVLPESLEPCHGIPAGLTECLVYFYIDIIHNCVIYHNNHIIRY